MSPGHITPSFSKLLCISKNSVFQDQDIFSKNRQKIIQFFSWGHPPYGAAPLPPTKVGAKCLAALVLDNQDCTLRPPMWKRILTQRWHTFNADCQTVLLLVVPDDWHWVQFCFELLLHCCIDPRVTPVTGWILWKEVLNPNLQDRFCKLCPADFVGYNWVIQVNSWFPKKWKSRIVLLVHNPQGFFSDGL